MVSIFSAQLPMKCVVFLTGCLWRCAGVFWAAGGGASTSSSTGGETCFSSSVSDLSLSVVVPSELTDDLQRAKGWALKTKLKKLQHKEQEVASGENKSNKNNFTLSSLLDSLQERRWSLSSLQTSSPVLSSSLEGWTEPYEPGGAVGIRLFQIEKKCTDTAKYNSKL